MRLTNYYKIGEILLSSLVASLVGAPAAAATAFRSCSSSFLTPPRRGTRSSTTASSSPLSLLRRSTTRRGIVIHQKMSSSSSNNDDDADTRTKQVLLLSLREYLQSSSEDKDGDTGDRETNNKNKGKIRLILASKSPRRSEILTMMGLEKRFEVIPSPLNEEKLQTELSNIQDPKDYTRILAEEKAKALANELVAQKQQLIKSPVLVLGSDTIVSFEEQILEKPKNTTNAKEMLLKLSGQQHEVHTGVCVVGIIVSSSPTPQQPQLAFELSFVDTAEVQFATLSEQDIDAYIQTGEPNDKAGSYGIQGIGGQFVSNVTGDFFTVMGLPMHRTSKELARAVQTLIALEDEDTVTDP